MARKIPGEWLQRRSDPGLNSRRVVVPKRGIRRLSKGMRKEIFFLSS